MGGRRERGRRERGREGGGREGGREEGGIIIIGSNKNGCLCIVTMNTVHSNNSTAVLLHVYGY